jgi:hypothetical protein
MSDQMIPRRPRPGWLAAGWWEPGGDGRGIVEVTTGRLAYCVDGKANGVEALAFAPDGTLAVSWNPAHMDRMGLYRIPATGNELQGIGLLADIDCQAEALAFTADGSRLAVCGPAPDDVRSSDAEPGMIALFDVASRQPVWSVPIDRRIKVSIGRQYEPVKPVCLCLVADDRLLAVGLHGGLLVLSTATGKLVKAWRWPGDVRAIHPTPDGTGMLVAARDGHHLIPLHRSGQE